MNFNNNCLLFTRLNKNENQIAFHITGLNQSAQHAFTHNRSKLEHADFIEHIKTTMLSKYEAKRWEEAKMLFVDTEFVDEDVVAYCFINLDGDHEVEDQIQFKLKLINCQ